MLLVLLIFMMVCVDSVIGDVVVGVDAGVVVVVVFCSKYVLHCTVVHVSVAVDGVLVDADSIVAFCLCGACSWLW